MRWSRSISAAANGRSGKNCDASLRSPTPSMSLPAKRLLYFLWLVLALGLFGCSAAEPPRVLPITHPPAFRPRGPQEVTTPKKALAAIVTVCTADLELPPVEPLY